MKEHMNWLLIVCAIFCTTFAQAGAARPFLPASGKPPAPPLGARNHLNPGPASLNC